MRVRQAAAGRFCLPDLTEDQSSEPLCPHHPPESLAPQSPVVVWQAPRLEARQQPKREIQSAYIDRCQGLPGVPGRDREVGHNPNGSWCRNCRERTGKPFDLGLRQAIQREVADDQVGVVEQGQIWKCPKIHPACGQATPGKGTSDAQELQHAGACIDSNGAERRRGP